MDLDNKIAEVNKRISSMRLILRIAHTHGKSIPECSKQTIYKHTDLLIDLMRLKMVYEIARELRK